MASMGDFYTKKVVLEEYKKRENYSNQKLNTKKSISSDLKRFFRTRKES